MMGFDWETPTYTQAELLKLVPGLKAKWLQNWLDRKVIKRNPETSGRGDRRKYTPIGVVMIDFVVSVLPYGISAAAAFEMAEQVADVAEGFSARGLPTKQTPGGATQFEISSETITSYRAAWIAPALRNGPLRLDFIESFDEPGFRFLNRDCIRVEIEVLIADVLNRMALHQAGEGK